MSVGKAAHALPSWAVCLLAACVWLLSIPAAAYEEIPCPPAQPNDIVLLLAGQSNNGSFGDVVFQPALAGKPEGDIQFWFGTGACYPLADPLAGFNPPANVALAGGSIWTRFSQLLRDQMPGFTGRVVIVDLSENATPITNWGPGGPNYPRIATAVNGLRARGWATASAMLFLGGESDAIAGQSYEIMRAALNGMVDGRRAAGDFYPIFIGINSLCRGYPDPASPYLLSVAGIDFENLTKPVERDYHAAALRLFHQSEVQRAQMSMADPARGVFVGANTDLISANSRWDHCHMGDYAQWLAAQLWLDELKRTGVIR